MEAAQGAGLREEQEGDRKVAGSHRRGAGRARDKCKTSDGDSAERESPSSRGPGRGLAWRQETISLGDRGS